MLLRFVLVLTFELGLEAGVIAQTGTAEALPRGEVIEKVACIGEPAQTYAVYLPKTYDAADAWPILYCFEPGARGAFVTERFRAGAERWGYLVVASNNSRNGPLAPALDAANAVFRDTMARFSIDRRRILVSGCSGGAGVALTVASQMDVFGIIVCAASMPAEYRYDIGSAVVFGTVGVDDFNFAPMQRYAVSLAKQKVPNRLLVFDGPHAWPPVEDASEALGWMELQAMRAGLRARDDAMLAANYAQRLVRAEGLPVADRLREMESLAADFDGFLDTTRAVQAAGSLRGHRDLRTWERELLVHEDRVNATTAQIMRSAAAGEDKQVDRTLAELTKSTGGTKDSAGRRIARRILGGLPVATMEHGRLAQQENKTQLAVRLLTLRVKVAPDKPHAHFELARAQIRHGSQEDALESLARAVALGLDLAGRTRNDPDFQLLQDNPEFQRLLASPTRDK